MQSLKKHWLTAILALSVILRVGASLYLGDAVVELPGTHDQISYDRLAQNLVAGHGFSFQEDWWPATGAGEPTAHWSYFYTGYLYLVYKAFGHHPLAARLIQSLLAGIAMPWLVFRLGRRLGGRRVGLMAAGVSAVYIYFVYYAAALMTETFFFLAVLGSLEMAYEMVKEPTWARGVWLGAIIGCGVLLRQTFLIFVPFLVGWMVYTGMRGRSLRYLLAVTGLPVVMMLPWTVRNYLVFDQFVLLNTNAGYVFFWGNHPIHGTNFISILPPEYPSYPSLIPEELRHMDEAALDKALLERGIQFVRDDPGRYTLLSLSRLKDYFLFWPKVTSGMISNISRVGSFGIFLPFMVYGLWQSSKWWRKALPLYAFIGVFTLVHLMSWALVRYRLPVDAVLVVFAGLALEDIRIRYADWRASRADSSFQLGYR